MQVAAEWDCGVRLAAVFLLLIVLNTRRNALQVGVNPESEDAVATVEVIKPLCVHGEAQSKEWKRGDPGKP